MSLDVRVVELLREAVEENSVLNDVLEETRSQLTSSRSISAYWRDIAESTGRENHELKTSAVRRNNANEDPLEVMKLLDEMIGNPGSNKIKLIKLLRNLTGCGLKEGKEAVEEWLRSRDEIKVGDTVRIIDAKELVLLKEGDLCKVERVHPDSEMYDYTVSCNGLTDAFIEKHEVEKVKG